MSDTQSLASEDSSTINGGAAIFVEIESVGKLSLAESNARVSTASQPYPGGPEQKKFAIHDGLIGKNCGLLHKIFSLKTDLKRK